MVSEVIEGEVMVLEEDIFHSDFVKFALEQGWIKEATQLGDEERVSFQEIWRTPDMKNIINYVDDPLTITRYLWIRGPKLKRLLFELCCRLPAYEPEEILQKAAEAEDHDEAVAAVLRVAAGFPRFEPDALHIFEAYLDSPSPALRKATIQAIAYRLWSETYPLLKKVSQEDTDEDVRRFAKSILVYLTES
jgi:hypothetical protein